jgi:hypothetical protein
MAIFKLNIKPSSHSLSKQKIKFPNFSKKTLKKPLKSNQKATNPSHHNTQSKNNPFPKLPT